jgi:hypothetical protein
MLIERLVKECMCGVVERWVVASVAYLKIKGRMRWGGGVRERGGRCESIVEIYESI